VIAVRKILVCYDGSAEAEHALERAAEVAAAVPSRVTVVSVAEPLYPVTVLSELVDPAEVQAHRGFLDTAARKLRDRGVEATLFEPSGDVADSIVDLAEQEAADLIVVGSRHRGVIRRLLFGSVSSDVIVEATCDVLVVR
jgi:nucleotide-binding universal stress UspA family protein